MHNHIFGLFTLVSLIFSPLALADLIFKTDMDKDLNALPGLHAYYGLGGAYATGFRDTQEGIEMNIGASSSTPELKDPKSKSNNSLGEFISLSHGFLAGHAVVPGKKGSNFEYDVATSFTITFNHDVVLNSIYFDDITTSRYKPNSPPQFSIHGEGVDISDLQGVDVNSKHNVNNKDKRGHVEIGATLQANQIYTVTVNPIEGAADSVLEFWKFIVTPIEINDEDEDEDEDEDQQNDSQN